MNRSIAGEAREQRALIPEAPGQRGRKLCLRARVSEGIRTPVPLAWRVCLVQRGLRHDNGPLRMPLARCPHRVQNRILLRVERLDDGDHQMRPRLVEGDVLRRVVAFFAKPARIEKADDGRFRGKVEDRRRPRAGLIAQPDLGRARLGERPDDGGFPRLHFPDEPDHRRRLAGKQGHLFVRWRGGLGRKHRLADALPAPAKRTFYRSPPIHDRHRCERFPG